MKYISSFTHPHVTTRTCVNLLLTKTTSKNLFSNSKKAGIK